MKFLKEINHSFTTTRTITHMAKKKCSLFRDDCVARLANNRRNCSLKFLRKANFQGLWFIAFNFTPAVKTDVEKNDIKF